MEIKLSVWGGGSPAQKSGYTAQFWHFYYTCHGWENANIASYHHRQIYNMADHHVILTVRFYK